MNEAEILEVVHSTIEKYRVIAEREFGLKLETPTIDLSLTGRHAGWAFGKSWKIRLNKALMLEGPGHLEAFEKAIIPHEYAHLVTRRLHGFKEDGVKPHGPEWRHVMHVFGLEPVVRHKMDTSKTSTRKTRKFRYTCDCHKFFTIGSVRHNRIVSGKKVFRCKKCNGVIKLMHEI